MATSSKKASRKRKEKAAVTPSLVGVRSSAPIVSAFPVRRGEKLWLLAPQQVAPGGSFKWYVSGTPGARVTLTLNRMPDSGGHRHGAATAEELAVGKGKPATLVLPGPYPQNKIVEYVAPQVCGSINGAFTFVPPSGATTVLPHVVEVLVPGLVPIQQSQWLRLKTPTADHPSPYWATPAFAAKIQQLADKYGSKTNKPFTVTDGSLQWGGQFDLNRNWKSPHAEHKQGRTVDIRISDMNASDKRAFEAAAKALSLDAKIHDGNHWHVKE